MRFLVILFGGMNKYNTCYITAYKIMIPNILKLGHDIGSDFETLFRLHFLLAQKCRFICMDVVCVCVCVFIGKYGVAIK